MTVVLIEKAKRRLRKIAAFTGTGNDLLWALEQWVPTTNKLTIEELDNATREWAKEVRDWLDEHLPSYTTHFANRAAQPRSLWEEVPQVGAGSVWNVSLVAQNRLSAWLHRLAEITMKL